MLRKLFKYEFKNTAKVMLAIYAVLIVTTLIGSVSFATDSIQTDLDTQPPIIQLLFYASLLLYILSVFALFIVTYVYVCVHFYKTMYSEQGYLTHTLPVKPATLFHVKLITSWVWMMGSMVLFFLSLFGILTGVTRGELVGELASISDTELSLIQKEFLTLFGMTFGQFWLVMFLMMAFSCLSYLLMVFVSISVGQLFNQHKIVWAVVTGIIIHFVEQMVGSMVLIISGNSLFNVYFNVYSIPAGEDITFCDVLFSPPMIASMILSVLFTVAFYIACIVIQKKHLNLE